MRITFPLILVWELLQFSFGNGWARWPHRHFLALCVGGAAVPGTVWLRCTMVQL